jgi:hypothetical protein
MLRFIKDLTVIKMINRGICKAVAVLIVAAMVTCCIPHFIEEVDASGGKWKKIWGPIDTVVVGVDHTLKPWDSKSTTIYATQLSTEDVYQYQADGTWKKIGGPGKMFVTAGLTGKLYALSPDGSGVWRYEGTPMQWTKIGGAAKEIYGGVCGLFATNPDTGDIYSYSETANSWKKIGGPGKMFAVGFDGIYGLSPDGMKVFGYGEGEEWVEIAGPIYDGAIDSIYVGGAGDELYATSADTGDLYHHTCGYLSTGQYVCAWEKIGGPGKMFAVDQGGNLYGLSPDGSGVWHYDGTPMQWTKIGEAAADIYVGAPNRLYATNPTTFELWEYFDLYFDLLILAPNDFCPALQPLQQHKNTTGISTQIVSLENINVTYQGKDEPEKVKKCIAYYEQNYDVKYVMLVGDCDKFPVRYICRDVPVAKGYQACDLYYSDLYKSDGSFDNWDGNGNGLYAQLDGTSSVNNIDNVDWHPDVAVARVPASTLGEVINYVGKVIDYEFNAYNADWFKRALLVTGDWGDSTGIKDYIATHYLSGFTIIKHYHTTVWPLYPIDTTNPNTIAASMDKRAQPMTNYINQGVGFINYYGHGNWDGFPGYDPDNPGVYCKRHLDDLTNTDKLPIIFAAACQTGEFAPSPPWQAFYDTNNTFYAAKALCGKIVPTPKPIQPSSCDLEARPEDWLVKRKTGAIAYVGSAGTGNPGYPDQMDKDFFEAYDLGHTTFGDMWVYVIQQYLNDRYDDQGNVLASGEWERYATWNAPVRFMPFGDPSLRVGGVP